MNTRSGRANFKSFQIMLDSGSSSTIVMGKLTSKLKLKESEKTMWETQAGKFTTSNKVNVNFCLSEFSVTKMVMWKFHVEEFTKSRYNMILGKD